LGVNAAIVAALWIAMIVIALQLEVQYVRNAPLGRLAYGFMQGYTNGLWIFALAFVGSLELWRKPTVRFLWVWLLITFLVAVAVNAYADFLSHPRHIMGILPILFTLTAIGLIQISQNRLISWLALGIWIGVGIVHALTPAFMNDIPGQVKTAPMTFMNTVLDTAETCVGSDDAVFFSLDAPYDEWENDIPLGFYLRDYDFRYLALTYALYDIPSPSILLQSRGLSDLNDAQPIDRFHYMIENAPLVWVFALKQEPLQHDLLTLDQMLNDAGYTTCPTMIDKPDILGVGYSRPDDPQCARILPCAE